MTRPIKFPVAHKSPELTINKQKADAFECGWKACEVAIKKHLKIPNDIELFGKNGALNKMGNYSKIIVEGNKDEQD